MAGNGLNGIAGASYAPIKRKSLLALAARTSTTTGSAVSSVLGPERTLVKERTAGRQLGVWLKVTAAAAGTLDLAIQGSDDGTTWVTMTPREGAWTQVTTTPGQQFRTFHGPLPRFIRAVGTQATSPNHTYSVEADLQ